MISSRPAPTHAELEARQRGHLRREELERTRVKPTPAAKRRVTMARKNDIDPGNVYSSDPVVNLHEIEGLPVIAETIRDETSLWNPDPQKPRHGNTQYQIGNNVVENFQQAILMAIAQANGVHSSEMWTITPHVLRMLGGKVDDET